MLDMVVWVILMGLGLGLAALAVYCAGAVTGVVIGLTDYYLGQLPHGARRLGRGVGRLIHRRAPARR